MLGEIDVNKLPERLKGSDHWIGWRFDSDGRKTPISCSGDICRPADLNNPATWTSISNAVAFSLKHELDGIGYVVDFEENLCSLDLLDCRDPSTGALSVWAWNVLKRLRTYSEVLPGGTGIRILVAGEFKEDARFRPGFEEFEDGRFIAVTGNSLPPNDLEHRSAELQGLSNDPMGPDTPVWVLKFDYQRLPGERPRPYRMSARELLSGVRVQLDRSSGDWKSPFGPDSLVVCFDGSSTMGCFESLNWTMPDHVLDLQGEFRWLKSGLGFEGEYDFANALSEFGVREDSADPLGDLFAAMLPRLDVPRALLRGRYTKAVARMESVGSPIDTDTLLHLRENWKGLRRRLIEQVDHQYRVYDDAKINPSRWLAWTKQEGIAWPVVNGSVKVDLETFRDMANLHPQVAPIFNLQATLAKFRPIELEVGTDGRNRCELRPFASKTGRNQPRSKKFIFGQATWIRGLIRPREGMALAYIDYEQQEFGIAAALSKDHAMREAYESGDPYLTFAKQAGAVPPEATKETHRNERELFKTATVGIQYLMGATTLSNRLGVPLEEAKKFLAWHKATYPTYWEWSKSVQQQAKAEKRLQTVLGWHLNIGPETKTRSIRNFPLQAHGAEILRLACIKLTEKGVRVCAPVHDAILIEAPADEIEEVVKRCQQEMEEASKAVLGGFALRTEAKIIRYPDRFMDSRGHPMWDTVMGLATCTRTATNRRVSSTDVPSSVSRSEVECVFGSLRGLVLPVVCSVFVPPSPVRVKRPFIYGPLHLSWLGKACELSTKALAVSLAVRYLAGISRRTTNLVLASKTLAKFGVNRHAKNRVIHEELEQAGLIKVVSRHYGKNPVVSLVDDRSSREYILNLDLAWIGRACKIRGKALAVALALQFVSRIKGKKSRLKLPDEVLAKFAVTSKHAKSRALQALEKAGLILKRDDRITVVLRKEAANTQSSNEHLCSPA